MIIRQEDFISDFHLHKKVLYNFGKSITKNGSYELSNISHSVL